MLGRLLWPVKLVFGIAAFILALIAVVWVVNILPGSLNPFKTETVDRSQPVLLKSIEDIGEYHAATANLELVVDLEQDAKFLPSFIKGDRTIFVVAGTVDAGVDMRAMKPNAVTVDQGTKKVTIVLPAAKLFKPTVDLQRSYVVDRKRGAIDRIKTLITNDSDELEVFQVAGAKLQAGAEADPKLLETARTNTTSMLKALVGSLGYRDVSVTYEIA